MIRQQADHPIREANGASRRRRGGPHAGLLAAHAEGERGVPGGIQSVVATSLMREVAMSIWKRRSHRSGRAPLASPGRPSVAGRDEQQRFWACIAVGMTSEDAAVEAGVSQPVGTRWFRKAGGMPPAMFGPSAKPLSGRYLSLAEREEIALLRVQGHSMQAIGRRLGLPRRSLVSCGATQPPAAAGWSIARQPPSGMPSDRPVARSRRSSPRT